MLLLPDDSYVYFGIFILSTHIRRQNTIQHCMLHILPEVAWPKYSTLFYSIQVTVTYIIYEDVLVCICRLHQNVGCA